MPVDDENLMDMREAVIKRVRTIERTWPETKEEYLRDTEITEDELANSGQDAYNM